MESVILGIMLLVLLYVGTGYSLYLHDKELYDNFPSLYQTKPELISIITWAFISNHPKL